MVILPPQIIYQGKANQCLPVTKSSNAWHITFVKNHWVNKNNSRLTISIKYCRKDEA